MAANKSAISAPVANCASGKNDGYYLMARGWQDHYLFKGQKFSERDAWCYLIEQASFIPHKTRWGNKIISVDRGVVPTSYRNLSDAWKWSVNRVRRFLNILQDDGMIFVKSDTGLTLISICNYNQYQGTLRNSDTQADTVTNTPADTQADTNRIKGKIKEKKEEENAGARECADGEEQGAIKFIEAFDHVGENVFGGVWRQHRMFPATTDWTVAKQLLADGVALKDWTDYCRHRLETMRRKGNAAPRTLSYVIDGFSQHISDLNSGRYKPRPAKQATATSRFHEQNYKEGTDGFQLA